MNSDSNSNINLIKLVEDTFTRVNEKIDELLDCSIKDFTLLNKGFQEHHSLLNNLSNFTNSFFKFILSSKHDEVIIRQCDEAEKYVQELNKLIKSQLTSLKDTSNRYSFILLNTNNLKQDISTIKLLFSNLRFDPSLDIDQDKIQECVKQLSDFYQDCENNIKILFEKLKQIISFSEEGFRNGLELHSEIIEKVNNQIALISTTRKTSIKFKKKISEIEERKTSSTSVIITNLQFQDILRQKIEHIQEAHNEITNNLYSTHKSGNKLSQHEQFQIRDISSLQSALLVHANQEYQTAVENILKRINEMRQLVSSYNTIWNHYCIPEKIKIQTIITKASKDLSLLNTQSFSLNQIEEKYLYLLTELSELSSKTNYEITSNKCMSNGISELEAIINKANSNNENRHKFSSIEQLKTELEKFQKSYSKLIILLNEFNDNIFNDYIHSFHKKELNTKELNKKSNKIVNLIKALGRDVEKDISCAEISETITEFGVEQIEYYNSFDKEVKEMITLFDKLLSKIDLDKNDIDKNEINHLKELYTMQSERDIHEQLTKEKSNDSYKDKDNNEVEFF